jgi:nucleoside-diphosphate-sugar epimerase
MVLGNNGRNGLKTVALRPHLILGPGDNHLVPTFLKIVKKGLRPVGTGENWADISYVENIADAHILALDALERNGPVDGNPYFISQGDPVRLWEWMADLLRHLGWPPLRRRPISFGSAYCLGALLEIVYGSLRISSMPPMTRFLAVELAKDHCFDISAAKMDLKYVPRISNEEGFSRLVADLKARGMGK